MVRQDGKLATSDWKTAVAVAGEKIKAGKEIVVLASGRLSNEDLVQL